MSFRFNFDAAALMSARTRLRVALFVRRLVTLVNPWVLANACMSCAAKSQAVSCPSHPLYCLGSTVLRPMWREAPVGITDPFVLKLDADSEPERTFYARGLLSCILQAAPSPIRPG